MTANDPENSNSAEGNCTGNRVNPGGIAEGLIDVLASLTHVSEADDQSAFGGTVTELLARLHAGDRDAEDGLYRVVIDQLVGKARKILRGYKIGREGVVEPEELVAEVFQSLRRVLASHDVKNRQQFFRIACNNFRWKILEMLKRRRYGIHEVAAEDVPEPVAGGTSISSRVANADLVASALHEIAQLDETQRQLMECHFYLDMSFREIGELLGQPHTTVRYRYQQIIQRLRDRLPGQG